MSASPVAYAKAWRALVRILLPAFDIASDSPLFLARQSPLAPRFPPKIQVLVGIPERDARLVEPTHGACHLLKRHITLGIILAIDQEYAWMLLPLLLPLCVQGKEIFRIRRQEYQIMVCRIA